LFGNQQLLIGLQLTRRHLQSFKRKIDRLFYCTLSTKRKCSGTSSSIPTYTANISILYGPSCMVNLHSNPK
jgi:hypothetical protein